MMAERFGGKYSPDGSKTTDPAPQPNAFDGKRRSKAGARVTFLFIAPLIFAVRAFQGDSAALVAGLAATGLMLLGAWLTREGIFAQEAYDARRVARRPALPRKIFGAGLIGAGLAVGAVGLGESLLMGAVFGVMAAGLHMLSFGADPLQDKGLEGVDAFQTDRVARAVDEGEGHLKAMRDAILRAGDRTLEARVERFATTARGLFRTVEGDPGDLTAARKYLSVYLLGARDATVKFADLYAQNRSQTARTDYETLLDDLESTFASRTTALLSNSHSDLDVEIAVLRDRLKYEN